MSPPDLWKWKWSNGVGKREMSIIWCISITNNVKSNKKFSETAQTAKFTDFPLIFGNLWKGSEKDQNYANANASHRLAKILWWFWLLKFFKPELWLVEVGSNFKEKNLFSETVQKKDTATILRFKLPYLVSICQIGMFWCWFNGRT